MMFWQMLREVNDSHFLNNFLRISCNIVSTFIPSTPPFPNLYSPSFFYPTLRLLLVSNLLLLSSPFCIAQSVLGLRFLWYVVSLPCVTSLKRSNSLSPRLSPNANSSSIGSTLGWYFFFFLQFEYEIFNTTLCKICKWPGMSYSSKSNSHGHILHHLPMSESSCWNGAKRYNILL